MPSPVVHRREQIKAQIADAKARADVSRASGIAWNIQFEGVSVDATALAFMPRRAAERWIQACVRKVCHTHGWSGKLRRELHAKLFGFWSGKPEE